MKNLNVLLTILLLQFSVHGVYAQKHPCEETMEEGLERIAEILDRPESKKLWGISLDAPVIIIDHVNNNMFFKTIEKGKVLTVKESSWNNTVPLVNSVVEYNGQKWVTIVAAAFMNASCEQRVNLLTHEIFHLHQNSLGIENHASINHHMDEVVGRSLLQIEMANLQQVLDGDFKSLQDALSIRTYRQRLYPINNEELYELNEGLAEYTGVKISIPTIRDYIKSRLNYDISKGYTNAFGYFTGAAYALILDELYPNWKQDEELDKGLIYLLRKSNPEYFIDFDDTHLEQLLKKYEYDNILLAEKKELESFGDIVQFKELLKPDVTKLLIKNNRINFTYNPNDRIISLGDAVLLRNMILKGEWGQVNVKKGIVRLNNWSAFYLLPPKRVLENIVEGENYQIHLNQGWRAVEKEGIYVLEKE